MKGYSLSVILLLLLSSIPNNAIVISVNIMRPSVPLIIKVSLSIFLGQYNHVRIRLTRLLSVVVTFDLETRILDSLKKVVIAEVAVLVGMSLNPRMFEFCSGHDLQRPHIF